MAGNSVYRLMVLVLLLGQCFLLVYSEETSNDKMASAGPVTGPSDPPTTPTTSLVTSPPTTPKPTTTPVPTTLPTSPPTTKLTTTLPPTTSTLPSTSTASPTTASTTTVPPTTSTAAATTKQPTIVYYDTQLSTSTTGKPPAHLEKTTEDKQSPSYTRLIESLKQAKIDLETENQRLKIAVGILAALIMVAVLFALLVMYLRRRNDIDSGGEQKSHRPNYFRPVSAFNKTPPVDPAMEYLHDDRLFVNDLDKEMETFKLNRGTNVMTSEL